MTSPRTCRTCGRPLDGGVTAAERQRTMTTGKMWMTALAVALVEAWRWYAHTR